MISKWEELSKFGQKLITAGLTHAHFGNISTRHGDKLLITSTGSMLDEIREKHVIELYTQKTGPKDKLASCETVVHRAIYAQTSAKAVIHSHSPYAVALSLLNDDHIEPIDCEGLNFLHKIPIVEGYMGSEELAKNVSQSLRNHRACIARGHGVFAVGSNLEEAYVVTCMVEHCSMIKHLVEGP